MSKEPNTPKVPEKKVDDIMAAYGSEPSKAEMNMVEAIITLERKKLQIRKQTKEQKQARKLNRGKNRGM